MKFIMWADKYHIIIAIMPPHSTHRLQPLDVGLFQPLATAYSKEISKLMSESYGLVSMTKRIFWRIFNSAWDTSFTEKNIVSAFAKTGIFPYDPSVILSKITCPEPVPELIIQEKTPIACASVRRIHKAYRRSPTAKRLGFIFHANIQLAAQHSIDLHTISGLVKSLKEEKKKRSRRKRLNLCGDENVGAQFYSPCTVRQAIAHSDKKEAEEQAERDRIEAKKITAAANKVHKVEEKAQCVLNTIERHCITAKKKCQYAINVQAQKVFHPTLRWLNNLVSWLDPQHLDSLVTKTPNNLSFITA